MSFAFLSFFAGFLLNLTPCVLPMLFVRIVQIMESTRNSSKIRISFLANSVGIIFAFVGLGVVVMAIKRAGSLVGFGFQFQNPYFVMFLALLMFMFSLNILGLYTVEWSFIKDYGARKKAIYSGLVASNIVSGVLSVLFATACGMPFFGTILSFSVMGSYREIARMFLFMGLGMASPFILIGIFPWMVLFLPTGRRMGLLNLLVGTALIITTGWLLSVLKILTNTATMLVFLGFLLAILLQFLLIRDRKKNLIMCILIGIFAMTTPMALYGDMDAAVQYDEVWGWLEADKIPEYLDDGQTVFVALTAQWCIVCGINEGTTLRRADVVRALAGDDVIAMRGDITGNNPEVAAYMQSLGVNSVPQYIVYTPENRSGAVVSGLLSRRKIMKMIGK